MATFRDTSQAVHFAYMIDAYPAGPVSEVARAVPAPRSRVDFGGLSAAEVRVECQRIRQSVKSTLPPLELAAIEARFSPGLDGKLAGLWKIAAHLADKLEADPTIMESIALRHYQAQPWSMRELAAKHGVSKDRILRLVKRMEREVRAIESQAFAKLQKQFESNELVEAA